jgi:hypothetical protein
MEELDIQGMFSPDHLATDISDKWSLWDQIRGEWKREKEELRDYLYATDTKTTSNRSLPWSNSTTMPKLTQIYDNLKANYTAALFPRDDWLTWEAFDRDGLNVDKAKVVKEYIRNKLVMQKFELEAEKLIDDFIQYGNCFATVEWVDEGTILRPDTPAQEYVSTFYGPRITRISPWDIVFNPSASTFGKAPKIIRNLVSLGGLKKMGIDPSLIDRLRNNRGAINGFDIDTEKTKAYIADGFSDLKQYYNSGYVEILTYYGDIYNNDTQEVSIGRKITVIDRLYVLSDEPIANWLGDTPIYHAGWRSRPDNLYAMGPLDNLVGMQYRIDHLENLRADVWDQVAVPMLLIKGDVNDFKHQPGERIIISEDGQVAYLAPDATALASDNQISAYQNLMEDFAGAPRQAMGIRTPGEKTAFEVQTLNDNASRIFQHKTAKFEREFLEPLLNAMLASARENLNDIDDIAVFNDDQKITLFKEVTKRDLATKGAIRPIGARNFAEKQRRTTELTTLLQIRQSSPDIAAHTSGKMLARMLANEIGQPELYEQNVGVREQFDMQAAAQDAEADMMEDLAIKQELGE